ncbi:60S ribosomal protein L24, partial [Caligus rogercresseyi]
DRALFVLWLQDLPLPRAHSRQARRKVFKFLDGRSHKAHLLKRNPRKVTWT